MGRGLTRSRSKSRLTAKEKVMAHKRKRSLSKIRTKLDQDGDIDFAGSDDEYELADFEHEEESVANPDVVEKYRYAARFTQEALQTAVHGCRPGASVLSLCEQADRLIDDNCKKIFGKTKDDEGASVYRGVAVPTTISVNDIVAYFRPETPGADVTLQAGDIVKINCGCHVDGYVAQAAHTVAVGGGAGEDAADCIAAAHTCAEVALRLMRPDAEGSNAAVTDAWKTVASDFGVDLCESVLSHRVRRYCIDGPQSIISVRITDDDAFQDVEDCQFGPNQVWHIDVVCTTRRAGARPRTHRAEYPTMLWKRNDIKLMPRLKAAHYVLRQVRGRYLSFPFSVSSFGELAKAKMGIKELQRYDMVDPLPVLKVKKQEVCARFCWTVMLTAKGVVRLCGLPMQDTVKPQRALSDAGLKQLLTTGGLACAGAKRPQKRKQRRAAAAAAAPADAAGASVEAKRPRKAGAAPMDFTK